jgi:plasmid stabilization system protein ParE
MSFEVLYTPTAKVTLNTVYTFIQIKFGERIAFQFLKKAEKTISLIAENPLMFKALTNNSNIRVGLITKQCSLFYRVTDSSIQLLYFWDNRQEPLFNY